MGRQKSGSQKFRQQLHGIVDIRLDRKTVNREQFPIFPPPVAHKNLLAWLEILAREKLCKSGFFIPHALGVGGLEIKKIREGH